MSPNCGDAWCKKSHSHRKQIIPDTGYADVRHALLFRNGETSPPGQNNQSWQDMASWQALAEIPTQKLTAETSDYSTCCYLQYEHNVYARMWTTSTESGLSKAYTAEIGSKSL